MQTQELITFVIVVVVGIGGLFLSKLNIKTTIAQVFAAALFSILFGYIIIGIQRTSIKKIKTTTAVMPIGITGNATTQQLSNDQLLQEAAKASEKAYAPYSKIKVGAAVLTQSNKLYTAANVENACYGSTICAERAAICKAISEGDTSFKAIAISSSLKNITPCGECRQFIAEFGKGTHVVFKYGLETKSVPLGELLPYTLQGK